MFKTKKVQQNISKASTSTIDFKKNSNKIVWRVKAHAKQIKSIAIKIIRLVCFFPLKMNQINTSIKVMHSKRINVNAFAESYKHRYFSIFSILNV